VGDTITEEATYESWLMDVDEVDGKKRMVKMDQTMDWKIVMVIY
jgi:hypothetical protein